MSREERHLHIYSDSLTREFCAHAVTWERRDSWYEGQWVDAQPEELPSQPVTTAIAQSAPARPGFGRFNFGRWA